jgi:hypothetical protein
MGKGKDAKKSVKKEPTKSPKEKKAEKEALYIICWESRVLSI